MTLLCCHTIPFSRLILIFSNSNAFRGQLELEIHDFTKADPLEFNANNDFPFPKDYDPEKAPRRIWQNRMEIEDMEKAEMEKAGK